MRSRLHKIDHVFHKEKVKIDPVEAYSTSKGN